jgi:hypothetical protein
VLEPLDPPVGTAAVAGVVTGEEVADLVVGEVGELNNAGGVPPLGPVDQGRADLLVGGEVLRPAGEHDFRLVAGGPEQRRQVAGGGGVGDPLDELVEPVEQQGHPPVPEQVLDLG